MKEGLVKPDSLYRKALYLFLDIYSNVIGDTIIRNLCYGGLYLVGGLTNAVASLILDPNTNFLK